MKVSYSRRALAQVAEIFAYLEEDNPIAAAAVVGSVLI
jgi:plasmid stabilization system protein ParE